MRGRGRVGGWLSWGGRNQLFLCNFLVCDVNQTLFTIEENTIVSEPLVNITVPKDQQVALGSSTPPYAFKLEGNQLFLNVIPDYEVQAVDWIEYVFMGTFMSIRSPNLGKIPGRRG